MAPLSSALTPCGPHPMLAPGGPIAAAQGSSLADFAHLMMVYLGPGLPPWEVGWGQAFLISQPAGRCVVRGCLP